VRYGEEVQLNGSGLTGVPYPAGDHLGGAYWVISDASCR
jgi:Cft2 family RNA processing exonuclease